jgi:hypothetical protein
MCFYVNVTLCYNLNPNKFNQMPYTEFQRLIGKAGLSIKEFAVIGHE